MFTHIKTSKTNREVVADLTRKLNLGTENIIARIAFTYSLSKERKLSLKELKDSGGKEYRSTVLFGQNLTYYVGLVCTHYGLYKSDKDIHKYIKLHIDDGLELLDEEISANPNLTGFDFLSKKIDEGLRAMERRSK